MRKREGRSRLKKESPQVLPRGWTRGKLSSRGALSGFNLIQREADEANGKVLIQNPPGKSMYCKTSSGLGVL